MGYGYVLALDDGWARELTPGQVAQAMVQATGTDAYPTTKSRSTAGPWTCVGAYHATQPAALRLNGTDLQPELVPVGSVHDGPFIHQLTAADIHRATRDAQRHPARLHTAMSRTGGDPMVALFGPDPLRAAASIASVWLLHADAYTMWSPDPAALMTIGEQVLQLLNTRDEAAVSFGSHVNALEKVGAVLSDDPVTLIWSGNRITTPNGLTEPERTRILQPTR